MDQPLRYIIVDDDDFDRLSVETEAKKFPFLRRVASCSQALEAAELIERHLPDVLFLDIEMPGISGLELVKIAGGKGCIPIFITSHPEFAVESYEIEAFDYLLKPLAADRFARCVNRLHHFCRLRSDAFAFVREQEKGCLVIKQGHDKMRIRVNDILYLEAMKDYTRVVLTDRQYLVLTTLAALQEKLPEDRFIRIHRSYVVNQERVTGTGSMKVLMGEEELPVGKLYRSVLKGIFSVLFFVLSLGVFGQSAPAPPDLGKLTDYGARMKAWVSWCEGLRLNASANQAQLRQAGLEGLSMSQPGDAANRSRFFTYAGLGYYYANRFDSAQYFFSQSLYAAQQARDTRQISRACVVLIPVDFQLQQATKVDSVKNILQSIVDTTRDRDLLEDGYYALGNYYQYKSFYSSAQDYFIRSLQLREKEVDTTSNPKKKFDYAIQCDLLSKLYLNTGMADKSLDALRKGERWAAVSPNVANRLTSSFVEAFTTSGRIDSALHYERKLEAGVGNPLLFPSEIVSSDLNIAIYYLDQKSYAAADPWIAKAEVVAGKVNSPLLNFQVQMARARYDVGIGRFEPAIELLDRSMPVAKQLDKELYSTDLKYMAMAEEGRGNTAAALQYDKEYAEITDSLNKEKLSRTFADLETRYQTNEKQQRIDVLDKENRLRALELENASRTRLLLALGLAAMGVISLLLYFFYRNKERLSRELRIANETKARLFGIIGHDLRSPVSRIVRLMQLQKEQPELFTGDAGRQHEEKIKKASESVLETMEDLLLWSKSQMQHFTPVMRPVSIAEVVDKEIGLIRQQDGGVAMINETPAGLVRDTDENFLSVILRNLLQNAVRYGGGVVVIRGDETELTIRSSGAEGLAEALNARIGSGQISSGNSGLGLQIAADLAAKLGTRFYFREGEGMLTAVLRWSA
ncbi:MAG TPA: LytTR family transcriptional regulator DNA-binding domain-containing protein [Puia sp.]|uniref:LytTR family transcriptional regulator DNA-binding domain-containing protein n=1 Tax=Puia sp. TaxID=2045100 RepID=UPI002C65EBCD|nr:LytTR family transcriptional regulator DNA-binding domain-containing protein [Puia sp.]HVU94052.1 LytTR family transcriptional regulator DNA-binding domain-containing protein [Puia sp.]